VIGGYLVLRGMEQEPPVPSVRLAGLAIVFVVFLALASLVAYQRDESYVDLYAVAAAGAGGGYVGSVIATALGRLLGGLGTVVTLVVVGTAGGVLLSGLSREQVAGWLEREPRPSTGAEPATNGRTIRINPGRTATNDQRPPTADHRPPATDQPALPLGPAVALKPAKEPKRERGKKAADAVPPPIFLGADLSSAPTEVLGASAAPGASAAAGESASVWTLPRVADILESGTDVDVNSAGIRERVEVIEQTLDSFGAPATVVEINQGPTITQFGVEPNYLVLRGGKRTKVKVGKIASLADDLALALAARSIRIQAPVPGKGYVGIEVPNSAKALVSLRDVMESDEYGKMKSPLRVGLGQNVAGQPIGADLAAMPHLLIAGTTGSGKSVCVNGLIACLLLQNTPDDLRLVMVDPKRVELTGYNGVPHLAAPVVVDMDRVIGTLQWALREMDNRYKLFSGVGARNIVEYNKKRLRDATSQKLPYIVIVIDELADLMMLAPEDTERSITRLAQMARATGIHMVIATQRRRRRAGAPARLLRQRRRVAEADQLLADGAAHAVHWRAGQWHSRWRGAGGEFSGTSRVAHARSGERADDGFTHQPHAARAGGRERAAAGVASEPTGADRRATAATTARATHPHRASDESRIRNYEFREDGRPTTADRRPPTAHAHQ